IHSGVPYRKTCRLSYILYEGAVNIYLASSVVVYPDDEMPLIDVTARKLKSRLPLVILDARAQEIAAASTKEKLEVLIVGTAVEHVTAAIQAWRVVPQSYCEWRSRRKGLWHRYIARHS